MRLWQEQLRTSDLLRAAGFRWRNGRWQKDTSIVGQAEIEFIRQISKTVGCVNSDQFAGIEPGRIMFVGMRGEQQADRCKITFEVKPATMLEAREYKSFSILKAGYEHVPNDSPKQRTHYRT